MNNYQKKALEHAKVLMAFAMGEVIESTAGCGTETDWGNHWEVDDDPSWDFAKHYYRVAQKAVQLLKECGCGERNLAIRFDATGGTYQWCDNCECDLVKISQRPSNDG